MISYMDFVATAQTNLLKHHGSAGIYGQLDPMF